MVHINEAGYQLWCEVQLGMERCDPQEVTKKELDVTLLWVEVMIIENWQLRSGSLIMHGAFLLSPLYAQFLSQLSQSSAP